MRGDAAWPKAILFDLDGTLIDSAPDLHAAVNILLSPHDLGPLTLAQVTAMIGHGVRKLVERAFDACGEPLDGPGLDREFAAMMEIYGSHLTVLTTLMPGARDAVEWARGRGVMLGLVTNKPQRPTEIILDHFRLSGDFGAVIGGDAGVAKKPAPDMLFAALDILGVAPEDALMVGDSPADVESGKAAGLAVVVVRGGYTNIPVEALGADCVAETLAGLAQAAETLRRRG